MSKERLWRRVCLSCFVAIVVAGCSASAFRDPTKINLFQSYPPGPVVTGFDCSLLDVESDAAKDRCVAPTLFSAIRQCPKQPQTSTPDEESPDPAVQAWCDCLNTGNVATTSDDKSCEHDVANNETAQGCFRSLNVNLAMECVSSTQKAYGTYLRCSEKKQLLIGFAIASLGAASATLAAASVSTLAAASLGGAAGGGLGLDYVFYNKARRGAYSNGIVQLQCIANDCNSVSVNLPQFTASTLDAHLITKFLHEQADVDNLYTSVSALDADLRQSPLYNTCKDEHFVKEETTQVASLTASYNQFNAQAPLVAAQVKIALKLQNHISTRLDQLDSDVISAVDTVDVRAFAAAQAGVPDADQLAKALQATSTVLTKGASAAPATRSLTKELLPSASQFDKMLKQKNCATLIQPINAIQVGITGTLGQISEATSKMIETQL